MSFPYKKWIVVQNNIEIMTSYITSWLRCSWDNKSKRKKVWRWCWKNCMIYYSYIFINWFVRENLAQEMSGHIFLSLSLSFFLRLLCMNMWANSFIFLFRWIKSCVNHLHELKSYAGLSFNFLTIFRKVFLETRNFCHLIVL